MARARSALGTRHPASVRDLTPGFPDIAYTTLMTTLDRLHRKGVLDREKQGRAFVYRPRLTQERVRIRASRRRRARRRSGTADRSRRWRRTWSTRSAIAIASCSMSSKRSSPSGAPKGGRSHDRRSANPRSSASPPLAFSGCVATLLVPLPRDVIAHSSTGSAARPARSRLADLRLLPTAIAARRRRDRDRGLRLRSSRGGTARTSARPCRSPRRSRRFCWSRPAGAAFRLVQRDAPNDAGVASQAQPVTLAGISAPALVVDSDFPVVTVVGLRRPRLVIARSVLESCSDEELRAILAHEQGHIDRHDNLRRLLLSIAPDVLNWLPVSAKMFAAWRDAAEEAADDDAARTGADGRLRLASALVKVARLAPAAGVHDADARERAVSRREPRASRAPAARGAAPRGVVILGPPGRASGARRARRDVPHACSRAFTSSSKD